MRKKKCTKCHKTKPLSEYFKNAKSKDGYRWRCKDCCSKYVKEWFAANPELKKASDKRNIERIKKRRAEDPAYDAEYRRRNREAQRKWLSKNSEEFARRRNLSPIDKIKNTMDRKKSKLHMLEYRVKLIKSQIKECREQIKALKKV